MIESKEQLLDAIENFLAEGRESDGGLAKVTEDDMMLLDQIIDGLIRLKCEADPDGDFPIEYALIDRLKGFWPIRPRLLAYDPDLRDVHSLVLDIRRLNDIIENYLANKLFDNDEKQNQKNS